MSHVPRNKLDGDFESNINRRADPSYYDEDGRPSRDQGTAYDDDGSDDSNGEGGIDISFEDLLTRRRQTRSKRPVTVRGETPDVNQYEEEERVDLVVGTSILPPYPICQVCGRTIDHVDFVETLMSAGHSHKFIYKFLELVDTKKDCCLGEYNSIFAEVDEESVEIYENILSTVKNMKNLLTTELEIVACSVFYLLTRGVGSRVICHLLQLPQTDFDVLVEGDCPTCGNLVPNKDIVRTLNSDGLPLTHYISFYDIPRQCCMANIIDGNIKTSLINGEVELCDRGVPHEEWDHILCRECGTLIGGLADDSSLYNYGEEGVITIDERQYSPHISSDCIRQAARWGLPMQYGYTCHDVKNQCCRASINNPIVQILASREFDIRRGNQIFCNELVIAK
jgi:hypothetical protein